MDRDIILVFGKTGLGKTTWAKHFLRGQSRVIMCDPQAEYTQLGPCHTDIISLIEALEKYRTFHVRTDEMWHFPTLCQIAMAAKRVWLVADEAQRVLPIQWGGDDFFLEEVIYRGRHRYVSLLFIAQRPTTVRIMARSQWTRIISFAQTEPADVKWLETQAGQSLPDIRELGIGEYYEITPQRVEKKYLDLGRARQVSFI